MNSPFQSIILNDNKRYIDWVESTKGIQKYLQTRTDFEKFVVCEKWFTRKFSLSKDKRILDMIDQNLICCSFTYGPFLIVCTDSIGFKLQKILI